jgi:LysR family transcriptional activator of nhaA
MESLGQNWLNYHHLYYFFVIAEKGSIAEASQFLKLGSPTLSTQLKQLEDRFNQQLFQRKGKQLILTEHGKVVYDYASEIFKLGSELSEVMREQKVVGKKTFRLGALDCIPKSLIASIAQTAYKYMPCSVTIAEGPMEQLLRDLHQHRLDLIVTNFSSYTQGENETYTRSVLRSPIAIFASSQFRDLKKGFPQSLDQAPIVLPSPTSHLRFELEHYFHMHNVRPDVVAETQDMAIQKLLGSRGMGVVPLPVPAVTGNARAASELVEIGIMDGVHEEYFLVSPRRKIENPIAAAIFKRFKA